MIKKKVWLGFCDDILEYSFAETEPLCPSYWVMAKITKNRICAWKKAERQWAIARNQIKKHYQRHSTGEESLYGNKI